MVLGLALITKLNVGYVCIIDSFCAVLAVGFLDIAERSGASKCICGIGRGMPDSMVFMGGTLFFLVFVVRKSRYE